MTVKTFSILPIPLSPDILLLTGARNFPLILYNVSDDGTRIAICRKRSYLFVNYNSVLFVHYDGVLSVYYSKVLLVYHDVLHTMNVYYLCTTVAHY
jgi:hypothetical protein